jgi:hypothetical protein
MFAGEVMGQCLDTLFLEQDDILTCLFLGAVLVDEEDEAISAESMQASSERHQASLLPHQSSHFVLPS